MVRLQKGKDQQGGFCKASNSVYREVTRIHICGGIMKSI